MTIAPLMPDVIALYVAYLRSRPEVLAIVGNPQRISTVLSSLPGIRIARLPGELNSHYDDARLQADCFAASENTAHLLARTVAAVTPGMPKANLSGGKVYSAAIYLGPYASPDAGVPGEFRYILSAVLTATP